MPLRDNVDTHSPEWVKRADDYVNHSQEKHHWKTGGIEQIIALALDVLIWYLLNQCYTRVTVLTEDFSVVLWLANVALYISMVGHVLRILYNAKWFKNLVKLVGDVAIFFAFYNLYILFPFDFTKIDLISNPESMVRTAVIVLLMLTGLSIVLHAVKFLQGVVRGEE